MSLMDALAKQSAGTTRPSPEQTHNGRIEEPLDALICALLRADPAARDNWHFGTGERLLARARHHGLHLVVSAALLADSEMSPDIDRVPLAESIRHAAAQEMARAAAVSRLLQASADAGVRPLLLKGDALAATVYPVPYIRPRSDTDLLIPVGDRRAMERTLISCGYVPAVESLGSFVSFQNHWTTCGPAHVVHAVDLHWRPFNTEVFAGVLGFEEMSADALEVTAFRHGRAPSLEHHLILTAVHRVAHHYDAGRLLWLYDIALLVRVLGAERIDRAADLAIARGVGPVVARGIGRAVDAFGGSIPDETRRRLDCSPMDSRRAIFLDGRPHQVDILRADLAMLQGWDARARLLREHLFPSAAYMRARYPRCPALLLPFAYLDRVVRGVPKWFARPTLTS